MKGTNKVTVCDPINISMTFFAKERALVKHDQIGNFDHINTILIILLNAKRDHIR